MRRGIEPILSKVLVEAHSGVLPTALSALRTMLEVDTVV
jgi:hypothetical protein